MEYHDRGIIKWAPFDALVGFNQMVKDLKYQLAKKDRPLLEEDQLAEMDQTIKSSINLHRELQIQYYQDGYIKSMYGYVYKIDLIERYLELHSHIQVALDDIVHLTIID